MSTPLPGATRAVLVVLGRQVERLLAIAVEEVQELVAVLAGVGPVNNDAPLLSTRNATQCREELSRRDGRRGPVCGREDATPCMCRRGASPQGCAVAAPVCGGASPAAAAASFVQNLPPGPRSAWRLALSGPPSLAPPGALASAAHRSGRRRRGPRLAGRRARPPSRGGWLAARR